MSFTLSRTILLALILVPALGGAGARAAECGSGPFAVSRPAEPLAERLQALSRLTGCAVDADPTLIKDFEAPALQGDLRTDEAFFASVAGSGLEAGPVQGRWRIARDAQDHYAERVATLEGKLGDAEAAGRIDAAEAMRLRASLATVREGVPTLVREQGFLSAAESASYDRTLAAVERDLAG